MKKNGWIAMLLGACLLAAGCGDGGDEESTGEFSSYLFSAYSVGCSFEVRIERTGGPAWTVLPANWVQASDWFNLATGGERTVQLASEGSIAFKWSETSESAEALNGCGRIVVTQSGNIFYFYVEGNPPPALGGTVETVPESTDDED